MTETRYVLSPPGGSAGPFWGVVSQSGQVIALQVLERQHANQLVILRNISVGDTETLKQVQVQSQAYAKELLANYQGDDLEGLLIKIAVKAIIRAADDQYK